MNLTPDWNLGLIFLVTSISLVAIGIAMLVAFYVIAKIRSGSQPQQDTSKDETLSEESVDLLALNPAKPVPRGPRLKLLGIDQRLVVLVLAQRGRGVQLPDNEELRRFVERITPGFTEVLDAHQPLFRKWPPQMSFEGFTHSLASNLRLPGEKGSGTPWSSIAGRISIPGGQLFVGLICFANEPGQIGQHVVEHEGKWTELLRVL